jgi:hypothetical protein
MSKRLIQYYSETIPANDSKELDLRGRYLRIESNTGSSTSLKVSIDDNEEFSAAILAPGKNYTAESEDGTPDTFDRVTLYNVSGASITVGFYVSFGKIDDSSVQINSAVTVNNPNAQNSGSVDIDTEDQADCKIASRSGRKETLVKNYGTDIVCITDASAGGAAAPDDTDGFILNPGDIAFWPGEQEFFFYKDTTNTGTQLISYTEFFR